jgi:serine acetyltransferase/GT2 family glycosyltransferase
MNLAVLPRLSVVIATHDRPELLTRLLRELADQTLPKQEYEVLVVDDGSDPPVLPMLARLGLPIALRLEEQACAGAAAARHRGIQAARGELLVLLDDDMRIGRDFLEQHALRHPAGSRVAVIGRIVPDPQVAMPLFERWHARMIDAQWTSGERPGGRALFSGNVSMRRLDYFAVGGFDAALRHSEDVELGLRLQKAGVRFERCEAARSLHASDHASLRRWRERSFDYGVSDLNPVSRPVLAATVLAPAAAAPLALLAYGAAAGLDALGARRASLAGATFAFGVDYFRGLRRDAGPLSTALAELSAYSSARLLGRGRPALLARALEELRQDQAAMSRYEHKYGHASASQGRLATDLVNRVGLQLLAGYRLMRALRDADLPLAAKAVSRSMRHLYGSDIHWDAELAPGVMVVHGFGLAISHSAKVAAGCILFQNVTLGIGTDPETREVGSPVLEEGVHVGPGATLLGPITVGAGSKVMAGAVLTRSVRPGSLVATPAPEVGARSAGAAPTAVTPVPAAHALEGVR